MYSVRKKKRNPVLDKKYDEGFEAGSDHAVRFFVDRFQGLQNVEGIGDKTMEKIVEHLGAKYFKGVRK